MFLRVSGEIHQKKEKPNHGDEYEVEIGVEEICPQRREQEKEVSQKSGLCIPKN